MYRFSTSSGAPPTVSKQNDCDQKYSFQSCSRITGNSFFINLLDALLYALINLLISNLIPVEVGEFSPARLKPPNSYIRLEIFIILAVI